MTLLTGMSLNQAISLEPVFAKLQDTGEWVLPAWLQELEECLALRNLKIQAIVALTMEFMDELPAFSIMDNVQESEP